MHHVRQGPEAVNVDYGHHVGESSKDAEIVKGLHELSAVGPRASESRKRIVLGWPGRGFSWQAGAEQAPVT